MAHDRPLLWLTVFLLALGACSSEGGPKSESVHTLDFGAFDDAVEAAIDSWNHSPAGEAVPIHGASVAVVGKSAGLLQSKGYGDFDAGRLYLVASASKILSAGVLMRLQDQGKLDIERPIREYLGDWGEHKMNVTVAQLLSNSSGLPGVNEVFAGATTAAGQKQYAAHLCEWRATGSLVDCGKSIYQDDTPENNREPDQEFRYGGSQWQLAGAIAEVVSGKSWAELIRETYVEPCGVASLGYTNQSEITAQQFRYPPTFDGDVADAPASDNPLIEGGAYATATDYAQLLLMHLRGGKCGKTRVLSEDAVETMRTDRVAAYGGVVGRPDSPFTEYGLGWWMAGDFIADPGAYGAFPAIGWEGEFGIVLLLEASSDAGATIMREVSPVLGKVLEERGGG